VPSKTPGPQVMGAASSRVRRTTPLSLIPRLFLLDQVALKRVPDVLASVEATKKVLREVCMLRRLAHPSLISLRGALIRPASRGPCRLINGALVPTSIDAYLALDYCAGGDLFSLRGPLPACEVRSLMRQAAGGLAFLHAAGVWHRDIKSSNLFLAPAPPGSGGRWMVKIGDFGSARSCWEAGGVGGGGGAVPPALPPPLTAALSGSLSAGAEPMDGVVGGVGTAAAPARPPWAARASDLAARPATAAAPGQGGGFRAPLTRCVATPLYRAPEVAMSRGGYTAAIDAWSLGCVFGELLHRVPRQGAAPPPPSLCVAPLFAVKGFGAGLPLTPASPLDTPAGAGAAQCELDALFDVVGTPSAADVAAVPSPAWRAHLARLPHRAPSLYRRLGAAGEVAVSLLASLLAFDPARRATPVEALGHEYFTGLDAVREGGGVPWGPEVAAAAGGRGGGVGVGVGVRVGVGVGVGAPPGAEPALPPPSSSSSSAHSSPAGSPKRGRHHASPPPSPLRRAAVKVAAARPPPAIGGQQPPASSPPRPYYSEADPALALALLEDEMDAAGAGAVAVAAAAGGAGQLDTDRRGAAGVATLRALLEAECAAAEAARAGGGGGRGRTTAAPLALFTPAPFPWRASGSGRGGGAALAAGGPGVSGATSPPDDFPPQVDAPPTALAAGKARVPRTGDAAAGALDPAGFLAPGRHGEWVVGGGGAGGPTPTASPLCGAWGVSQFPPGMDVSDPAVAAAVRRQQAR